MIYCGNSFKFRNTLCLTLGHTIKAFAEDTGLQVGKLFQMKMRSFTTLVFCAVLLGCCNFLLYLFLQVLLFLRQHFLGFPEFVDGLLG